MQLEYKNRLLKLPKVSLVIRNINGKEYCYLRYREGRKIIQKYSGTVDCAPELKKQIQERKYLLNLIDMLENEHKKIVKMEEIR